MKVLLVAEAANPQWVSVPLVGWSHARALCELVDGHVVTQVRNRPAIEETGWVEGREFTAIDSEAVAAPVAKAASSIRRVTGLGWTVTTAAAGLSYQYFEAKLWQRFGPRIRAREFDIVHRVTPLSPTISSGILARGCRSAGVPFVWGPINGGVGWPKGFSSVQRSEGEWLSYVRGLHRLVPGHDATRKAAAALIVGSRATLEQFQRYQDKCVYIPENAVDMARFGSLVSSQAESDVLRIAFVGRLVPYKGADMLIEAAAPFVRSGRVLVDVIGDGPELGRLRALRKQLGIEQGILLDGWVLHTALAERLSKAQVFGFPSVREFGGGAVLEAMALGLVPVVAGYAGPDELVTPQTGIRVPIGRREDIVLGLASAIEKLLDDRESLATMSRRARDRVSRKFTWEAKAKQTLEVYRWVLDRGPKPDFGMPFPD